MLFSERFILYKIAFRQEIYIQKTYLINSNTRDLNTHSFTGGFKNV